MINERPGRPWLASAVAVAVAVAVAGCAATPDDPVDDGGAPGAGIAGETASDGGLLLQLQPGAVLRRELTEEVSRRQTVQGQTVTMTFRETNGLSFTVEEAAPERLRLRVRFDHIVLEKALGSRRDSFDSRVPSDSVPPEFLAAQVMAGLDFGVVVDGRGRIVDLTGVDGLVAAATARLPDGPHRASFAASLARTLEPARLRQRLQLFLPPPVDGPLEPGHHWPRTEITPGDLPLRAETTWTVGAMDSEAVSFHWTGAVSTTPAAVTEATAFSADMSGNVRGELIVDPASGWVRSRSQELELHGTWTQPQRRLSFPVDQTTRLRIVPLSSDPEPGGERP